ncbi:MAG: prolipoprotein diacylglyceryl transferase [Patescibacteria group bacterium]
MIEWWQHIPENLNPIVFTVGFFSFYWYAFFYLLGWASAFFLAKLLVAKGVSSGISQEDVSDLFVWLLVVALLGGKIGYLFFYMLPFFPMEQSFFLPYDFASESWQGIAGMSYHGSLIAVAFALLLFYRAKKLDFWKGADMVALCAPLAIFFGRLGNFVNTELPGRITAAPWGMYFPEIFPQGVLRHPSSLYEAFFEGILLFLILLFFRKQFQFSGALATLYLMFYAVLRFIAEIFREPDVQVGYFFGGLTLGQVLSLGMFIVGLFLFLSRKSKKYGIL